MKKNIVLIFTLVFFFCTKPFAQTTAIKDTEDKIFTSVQVEAAFQGGPVARTIFLKKI